ncbi:DUF4296 domain-containing protein [Flavobacterium aestuarii]|uniref:DUF4296 domain-containing protein n=1 Tax=Flavobacterium aestuarii TaxID=3149227 RepID=UPI0032B41F46
MRKTLSLFVLAVSFFSCNKDLVEKPDNLIEKKVMENIFYDMALLDVIKYQSSDSLYKNGINPKTYIFKKYKIDSTQFAQSNAYYAADYREYKKMYDALNDRLKKEKDAIDLINKKAEKKEAALKKAKGKKVADSIKKIQKEKELKIKKEKDSISKAKNKSGLKSKK